MNDIRTTYSYDDYLLVPQYSEVKSRKDINIGNWLDEDRGLWFNLPIISSPMDTITEEKMAVTIAKRGGLGIIHRYNSVERQVEMAELIFENVSPSLVGFAIGVSGDYLDRAKQLVQAGAKILCVDVAHGNHILMKNAIAALRKTLGETPHIMAGNVATLDGANNLASWGANSVRVGIGGGSICFVAGTLVRTENGLKKIEEIEIGDKVYTHLGRLRSVLDTLSFERDEEIISINGIECTKTHEFYTLDREDIDMVSDETLHSLARWIPAKDLDRANHVLVKLNSGVLKKFAPFSPEEIITIEYKHYKGMSYDLTVQTDHSYNVDGIIVHNCSTRIQTGHGVPSLDSVIDCSSTEFNVAIIADGGIKNSGDIAKALAGCADFAMIGSIFAGSDCTPGNVMTDNNGNRRKVYRGMASESAQMDWRGKAASLEGISTTVPYKGPTTEIIDQLDNGIRSAFSYSGARTIGEFWSKSRLIRQSASSAKESGTHILSRD